MSLNVIGGTLTAIGGALFSRVGGEWVAQGGDGPPSFDPPAGAEFTFDFEGGDFSEWSAESDGSSQLAVTEAAARNGTYGMELIRTVRANAFVRRAITSDTNIEFSWHMRVSSDFTADAIPGQIFIAQLEDGSSRKASIGMFSGTRLRIVDWQNFSAQTGSTLDTNTWYEITLAVTGVGTASAQITLAVDGTVVATRSGSDWSAVSITNVKLGQILDQAWGDNAAGTIWFDDAYIDTTSA